jgi:hypothetical protein
MAASLKAVSSLFSYSGEYPACWSILTLEFFTIIVFHIFVLLLAFIICADLLRLSFYLSVFSKPLVLPHIA